MSRVAKNPIRLPNGVEVKIEGQTVSVKGAKGAMTWTVHPKVQTVQEDGELRVSPRSAEKTADAIAGTTRAVLNNLVTGVSAGFERKLELQGVGYRAQAQGNVLNLQLGFSHPVAYQLPEGISVATPTQTEVIISGCDRQRVGQVAAEIRGIRPPEPYKGKGVRYAGERVRRKEAKKK
ncbi:MAG: 50S ribosomal protein L6 [Pseudomonadales bacterium]|nr:50S ribosomal protein L6 [Pseudomonadales bacterium]